MSWFSFYQINHKSDTARLKLSSVSHRMKLEFSEANTHSSLVYPKSGNFQNLIDAYSEFPLGLNLFWENSTTFHVILNYPQYSTNEN